MDHMNHDLIRKSIIGLLCSHRKSMAAMMKQNHERMNDDVNEPGAGFWGRECRA